MSLSHSQSGLTLIELLIGIAISVLIMLAAFTLLLNLTQSSARVVQTQDVSGAVRASVGYATRRLSEAGFGIPTSGTVLTVSAGSGSTVGNAATFRSRTVSDAMAPVLPGEIEICTLRAIPRPNDVPILEETCVGRPPRTIMTGTVGFEVHSGCSANRDQRVTQYRRDECAVGQIRRTIRTTMLVRASTPDPVVGRLVAEDTYSFPSTVENPQGTTYVVPTLATGPFNGCEGDCRQYKHRLLITETVPRNELLINGVAF